MNGKILLLGVHHDSNTSLHYAEVKAELPNFPMETQGAALLENGKRLWKAWKEMKYDADIFAYQFPIVGRFVQHLAYYRAARLVYDKLNLKSPFWCATINASQDCNH